MDKRSLRTQLAGGPRIGVALSVLLSAFLVTAYRHMAGQEQPEHPFIDPKDFKSETCLTCHAEKSHGKNLHKALEMGCETCHEAKQGDTGFTISLLARDNALCFNCHDDKQVDPAKMPQAHQRLVAGECTACHQPHATDNVRRLRASINDVCLECHGQASALSAQNGLITIFGQVQIPATSLKGLRRISISGNTLRGHPLGRHLVSGPNPLQPGAPVITCVTCHNPHALDFTKRRFQLKAGVKSICLNCHA